LTDLRPIRPCLTRSRPGDAETVRARPNECQRAHAQILGEPAHLDARVVDDSRDSIPAVVETADGSPVAELQLRRTDTQDDNDRAGGGVSFAATWRPGVTGHLRVRVDDPALAGGRLTVPVEVFTPDDELRRPETDHTLLATLASDTGGRTLPPQDLGRLASLLPNRSVTTINPLTERIWDTPLVFGLVLLLITFEWIGRKLIRLA